MLIIFFELILLFSFSWSAEAAIACKNILLDPVSANEVPAPAVDKWADRYFYLRNLPEIINENVLVNRYNQIRNFNKQPPLDGPAPHYFIFDPDGISMFGDYAIPHASLAADNVGKKVYVFRQEKLSNVISLSEFLVQRIVDQTKEPTIKLFRIMREKEYKSWQKKDSSEFINSFKGQGLAETWIKTFGSQVIYFSIDTPTLEPGHGSKVIEINIPKDKFLEWSNRGDVMAGNGWNSPEFAVLPGSWVELLSYYSNHAP